MRRPRRSATSPAHRLPGAAESRALEPRSSRLPSRRFRHFIPLSLDATIKNDTAAIVQWQNAALWQRMSWVRTPLAAPILPSNLIPSARWRHASVWIAQRDLIASSLPESARGFLEKSDSARCPTSPWPTDYAPFHPRFGLTNGHAQTILGNLLPRRNQLPSPVAQLVEVAPARGHQISSQVLCECHWQPPAVRATRPTVDSVAWTGRLLALAVRHRQRQQALARRLQRHPHEHAQLRRPTIRWPRSRPRSITPASPPTSTTSCASSSPPRACNRSRSSATPWAANIMLKLAGELGAAAPPQLHAVVGVSPGGRPR